MEEFGEIKYAPGRRVFKLRFERLNVDNFDDHILKNDEPVIQAQHMMTEVDFQMLDDEFDKTSFSEYILDQLVLQIKKQMREQCMSIEKNK